VKPFIAAVASLALAAAAWAAPSITIPTGVRSNVWEPGQPIKLEATLKELPADAKATVSVVDYWGKPVLKKDAIATGKTLPIDLGPLPPGYYEATVAIGEVTQKATLGVAPFSKRTAAEVRQGGYRFGLKKYNLNPNKPNTYHPEIATATSADLGLQWTRELLQHKTPLGTVEMVNKYAMNVVMKVERFPKELYDDARYGPMAEWEAKYGKGVWSLKTLPKEAEYKKWLREEVEQIPPEQKVFEVWNEAWDKMNPEDFATICQWISEVILSVRPDAIIGPNLQGQMSPYEWDARVIKAGGMKGMKMVALHPYAGSEDREFIRKYRKWVSDLVGYPIEIHVTEFGSHSTPEGPAKRTETEQAQRVVRQALSLYVEDVKTLSPHWMGQMERNPTYIEDWYGFFRLNGQPKPVLIAYAAAARMVDGSKYVGDLWLGPECDAMLFERNGVYTLAIGTKGETKAVDIKPGVGELTIVDMVGNERKFSATSEVLKVDAGPDWTYIVGVDPNLAKHASTELREDRWPKPAKPPRITRTMKKLGGPFAADGKIDEFKGALQLAQSNPKVNGDDASGMTYLAWDDQNLYFALDMRDNEMLNKRPRPKLYQQDSIELFVSTEPREQNSGYGKGDFQMFITPTSGEDKPIAALLTDREGGVLADLKDPKFYAGKKNAGWIVELAIPWSTFGDFKPKAGAKLALEVRVNDADTSHERWKLDPVDNQSYRPEDPTGWSYLILED
jgi:hypothetical protein